jgi:hypothetical protein
MFKLKRTTPEKISTLKNLKFQNGGHFKFFRFCTILAKKIYVSGKRCGFGKNFILHFLFIFTQITISQSLALYFWDTLYKFLFILFLLLDITGSPVVF